MNNKKKSGIRIIVWSVIGVIVIAAVAFLIFRPKNSNYVQFTAKTGDITTYYSFNGNVEAKNKQTVFAEKALQIKEISVVEGQEVKANDVLMTTTTGDRITAKIDGIVSNIYPEVNAQILPGGKLADITDYTQMQLRIQVDEFDLSALSVGKAATVTIHALNKDVDGTITDISRDGTFLNGVTFFNAVVSLTSDPNLLVGMSAEAKVLNQSVTGVVTLPISAIQFEADNTPFVDINTGKTRLVKITKTDVTLGINDGVNVEIVSGLASGDIVYVPQASTSAIFSRPGNGNNTANRASVTP
jgi:HlyD family secretion protein